MRFGRHGVAKEPPDSLEEVRVDAEIGDDPAGLAATADAVVRGCSIRYARIKSLRGLIEAVHRHPDATLAPPADERGDDWKPPDPRSPDALTKLAIYGGEIDDDGEYRGLDIRVTLTLRTHFGGDVRFGEARFGGDAGFDWASFSRDARFARARFGGDARFDRARFGGDAGFYGARFGGNASFGGATFGGATFGGHADFSGASFAEGVTGDLRPYFLRTATFAEATQEPPRTIWARTKKKISNWCSRTFGWHLVRALGQLQILNRISVVAIIAVPVLAALTAMLQAQFPEWPSLGKSLALAFFAAVFVTFGLLVYQIFVPDSIRKHDEDEFIDLHHQRYPEDAKDRNDGLRRAIDHLEAIAKKRPDRHPNFVEHHGDTIWIPPRDEIGWFEDWKPPAKENDTGGDDAEKAEQSADETGQSESGSRMGVVPGAERRRITIEEGAKAEYWLKSREKLVGAWASFILYGIGIGCLLAILVIQSNEVRKAAGWWVVEEQQTVNETAEERNAVHE